ncbi:winged helix-turn-helix domain-containing protein [Enterococcus sp. LJL99]
MVKILGVVGNQNEIEIQLMEYLQTNNYQIILVTNKEQLKEIDGLLIINNGNSLTETVEWLLYAKEKRKLFVWIIFSQLSEQEQNILLELGANDIVEPVERYLVKLSYIIKNTFACLQQEIKNVTYITDHYYLNEHSQSIRVNGKEKQLTRTEYKIFQLLFSRANTTVTYEEILTSVWPETSMSESGNLKIRIANVIFHLREKIRESSQLKIRTTRSKGYMLKKD